MKVLSSFALSFAVVLAAGAAHAAPERLVAANPVGPHARIFVFKKNENPENIMIAYTKIDSRCRLEKNGHVPVLDFYWLMNGREYKPVHPLIKQGIRDRLTLENNGGRTSFSVNVNDLREMKHDIANPRLLVRTTKNTAGKCVVESLMTLGLSDRNAVVRVSDIHAEAKPMFLPPFRSVVSITINGVETRTNRKISRKYVAR